MKWFVEYIWNILIWIEQGFLVLIGSKYNDSFDSKFKKFICRGLKERRVSERRKS